MPRAALSVPLLLLALGACRTPHAAETCDLDALLELGDALAGMSDVEQANHVWPGLAGACGNSIPAPLAIYFEPLHDPQIRWAGRVRWSGAWTLALQRAACPRWPIPYEVMADDPARSAFERCEFARYEVLAASEATGQSPAIMTFAMHQWLLDQSIDGRVAAPITRALFTLEQIKLSPF